MPHCPPVQVAVPFGGALHAVHAVPPAPHALGVVPSRHSPAEQQPLHEVLSQAQVPLTQCCPWPHAPVWQIPPQPSLAPQVLPAQLGAHPHVPGVPAPPHVSGGAQSPPVQHGCPLPPQAPHVIPQIVPLGHTMHATPPAPHAPGLVPDAQVTPLQHPEQEVGSQAQLPCTQCCPVPQAPLVHTPLQPSLAPQALPAQLGVQVANPQTLGALPPPQV